MWTSLTSSPPSRAEDKHYLFRSERFNYERGMSCLRLGASGRDNRGIDVFSGNISLR